MKRINENPPARFPARAITEAAAPWWVAKVKPRQEKAIAFDFIRNSVGGGTNSLSRIRVTNLW